MAFYDAIDRQVSVRAYLLVVGVVAIARILASGSDFIDTALQAQRDLLASSYLACFIAGCSSVMIFPTVLIPLCSLVVRRKRSINHALFTRNKELPPDYWLCVYRVMLAYVLFNALNLRYMSTAGPSRVPWGLYEFTFVNTMFAVPAMLFMHDFAGYWYHRFAHSKLLYKTFHRKHHVVEQCNNLFDGFYGEFQETCVQSLLHVVPIMITPGGTHFLAAMVYTLYIILFKVVLNHSGRDLVIAIPVPGLGRFEIFNTQHHDDHHAFRFGNYADMFPIFDEWFDTQIKLRRKRRTLPGVQLWRRALEKLREQNEKLEQSDTPLARRSSIAIHRASEVVSHLSSMLMEAHPECMEDFAKLGELSDSELDALSEDDSSNSETEPAIHQKAEKLD